MKNSNCTKTSSAFVFAVMLAGAGVFSQASAAVLIVNPGFEGVFTDSSMTTAKPLDDGGFTPGWGTTSARSATNANQGAAFVPGWTSAQNNNGVLNPTDADFPGIEAYEGNYAAYANGSRSFSQTLSANLAEGTYTLSVRVGVRATLGAGTPLIQLSAGALTLTPTSTTGTLPAAGAYSLYTLTYNIAAGDPNIGETLAIRLGNSASAAPLNQIIFDDVVLIPEPSTAALMALASSAFLLRRRRRKDAVVR